MSAMSPIELVQTFVDRINAGDVEGIVALMTEDHKFTDSLGTEFRGPEKMRQGWTEYFRMVPDYRIEVREILSNGEVVVLLGIARGTYSRDGTLYPENGWETPAAWRALVRGDRVAEWQIYTENEPISRRMSAALP